MPTRDIHTDHRYIRTLFAALLLGTGSDSRALLERGMTAIRGLSENDKKELLSSLEGWLTLFDGIGAQTNLATVEPPNVSDAALATALYGDPPDLDELSPEEQEYANFLAARENEAERPRLQLVPAPAPEVEEDCAELFAESPLLLNGQEVSLEEAGYSPFLDETVRKVREAAATLKKICSEGRYKQQVFITPFEHNALKSLIVVTYVLRKGDQAIIDVNGTFNGHSSFAQCSDHYFISEDGRRVKYQLDIEDIGPFDTATLFGWAIAVRPEKFRLWVNTTHPKTGVKNDVCGIPVDMGPNLSDFYVARIIRKGLPKVIGC